MIIWAAPGLGAYVFAISLACLGAVTMIKASVEIDQEALAVAAEVLGTKTKKDTVNAALREVGQRLVRLRALAGLGEMADRGDFDEFVGNKAAYRK